MLTALGGTPSAGAATRRAVSGTPLWSAGMEDGSLSAWSLPSPDGFGGGMFNSGGGFAAASRMQHHSGAYSARLRLPSGKGGTRLFRWRELRRHREVAVSVWLYFPVHYRVVGGYFNVFQFKSRSPSGAVDPIWYLDVVNPGPRRMRLDLLWWHRRLEGPWPRHSGFRRFGQSVADVPVGRWFKIKATLRQSSRFGGALVIWQDQQRLFEMTGVRTSYANCAFNAWCTSNEWSVNNYSDGLRPAPSVLYADDAAISSLPARSRRNRRGSPAPSGATPSPVARSSP